MRSHLTFFNHFPTRLLRNARRAFRAASILLWGAALFGGCTSDIEEGPGLQPEQPASENKLTLSISIPDVSASSPGTYALTTGEEGFQDGQDSFHVLLFGNKTDETTDAKYEFMQFVEPKTDQSSTPGRRNFTIEIPLTDPNDPAAPKYRSYKAMVIANYTLEDGGSGDFTVRWERLLAEKTLEESRKMIQFSQQDGEPWNTAAGTKRYLPLYGESPAFDEKVARIPNIEMRRAVARIDVGVNIGGGTPAGTGGKYPVYDLNSPDYHGNDQDLTGVSFKLTEVTLYNAASAGYVAVNPKAAKGDLSYNAPAFHGDKGVTYKPAANGSTQMFRREIYLPETPNKFDDDTRAFYIVVGGDYNNSGTTTYYRIDFYDRTKTTADDPGTSDEGYVKPTAQNRFNILRNNAYVINILRVRGPGHASREIAALSEPINMEVDVCSWDTGDGDLGHMVTDGQYNLSVSATRLRYHSDGTAQDLKVFTNYLLANKPDESGWRMTVKRPDNMSDTEYDELQKQVLFFGDDGKTPLTFDDVKSGAASITKTLHVGLTPFSGAGDQMERTVTLVFTAGRMRQEVELIQDVKNLNTLTLSPERLSFPKRPAAGQTVVVRSSPVPDNIDDLTYYVTWTTKDGELRRMNISKPDADPTTIPDGDGGTWESLGGWTKIDKSLLPEGFDCALDHQNDQDPKKTCVDQISFFKKSDSGDNMFYLCPSDWDTQHTDDGTDPTQPRDWNFVVEAYWASSTTAYIPGAYATLQVVQSHEEVKWEVVDAKSEGDIPTANKLPGNTVQAKATDRSVVAFFRTNP